MVVLCKWSSILECRRFWSCGFAQPRQCLNFERTRAERRKGEVFLECTIAGPYVTMAVAVCFESVLRNQHKVCSRRPPVSVASRHLGVSSLLGSSYGLEIRLRSLPVRRLQQRGRLCVRCSSTADASRDSCMPLPTLYELLEVSQHVGLPEIKVAYRQMARRYHPDVCPPTEREECTRRFMQVQEAYDTLSDPHLRADYDLWLQNPLNTRTLSAGFRAGNRRRTGKSDMDANIDWKDHWELQLQGLRSQGERGGKHESWAAQMRQRREVK